MIIYEYEKDREKAYILHVKKNISKRKFLKILKLDTDCFSGKLFSRIYDGFFSEMIDLHKEYIRYHNCEYKTFQEFLQKKYNLNRKVVENGVREMATHKNTSLFFRKNHVMGDYNLEMFVFSTEGVLNILKSVLGVLDEN